MTYTTKEAPPLGGASNGDAVAYNRPGHRVQDERDVSTIPDRPTKAELTRHNRDVVSWADQFDPKYRNICKTLGFMADIRTFTAYFRIETFRDHYRKRYGGKQISRMTVYRRFRELEDAGVIKRTAQYRDDGSQRSSKYEVNYFYIIQNGVSVYIGPPDDIDAEVSRAAGLVQLKLADATASAPAPRVVLAHCPYCHRDTVRDSGGKCLAPLHSETGNPAVETAGDDDDNAE